MTAHTQTIAVDSATDAEVLSTLESIMRNTDTTYVTLGPLAGVSPTTLRIALVTQTLPKRRDARDAIRRFVAANAHVRSRFDLRFT